MLFYPLKYGIISSYNVQYSGAAEWLCKGGYERILTAAAVVVHQYDLFQQVCRGPLDGRVDGAQQHR